MERAGGRDGAGAVRARLARAAVPDAAGRGARGAGAAPERRADADGALAGGRCRLGATRACRGACADRAARRGQPPARTRPGKYHRLGGRPGPCPRVRPADRRQTCLASRLAAEVRRRGPGRRRGGMRRHHRRHAARRDAAIAMGRVVDRAAPAARPGDGGCRSAATGLRGAGGGRDCPGGGTVRRGGAGNSDRNGGAHGGRARVDRLAGAAIHPHRRPVARGGLRQAGGRDGRSHRGDGRSGRPGRDAAVSGARRTKRCPAGPRTRGWRRAAAGRRC